MFIGEYLHSLDEKKRLSIPVKFRANLADGCIITRGLDGCLWIYTKEKWKEFAEKVSALPLTQKNARSFARLMLAGASDCDIDKNGRIIIPKYLLGFALIGTQVAINGVYDRIEIWAEDKWQSFKKDMEKNSDEIAETLSELGL